MKHLIQVLILTCSILSIPCLADIAVVVHPSNNAVISVEDIERIFLGKKKSFSTGETAVPINLNDSNTVREIFNEKVLNKNSSQLKAYWSKLVFTGKGIPPKEVDSVAEMIKLVSNNPNMIGYVDSSEVNNSVKVIYKYL